MIKITIPNNNLDERKYIIDIIFNEFLELEYNLQVGSTDYEIVLENDKRLIIKDSFFSMFVEDLEYLSLENIPKGIKFVKNDFIVENDIPIIFGNKNLDITTNEIVCNIDIFASIFFMLTRWEEYVNKNRDNHHRFPAYESLAFKNNFLAFSFQIFFIQKSVISLFHKFNTLSVTIDEFKSNLEISYSQSIDLKFSGKDIF